MKNAQGRQIHVMKNAIALLEMTVLRDLARLDFTVTSS